MCECLDILLSHDRHSFWQKHPAQKENASLKTSQSDLGQFWRHIYCCFGLLLCKVNLKGKKTHFQLYDTDLSVIIRLGKSYSWISTHTDKNIKSYNSTQGECFPAGLKTCTAQWSWFWTCWMYLRFGPFFWFSEITPVWRYLPIGFCHSRRKLRLQPRKRSHVAEKHTAQMHQSCFL